MLPAAGFEQRVGAVRDVFFIDERETGRIKMREPLLPRDLPEPCDPWEVKTNRGTAVGDGDRCGAGGGGFACRGCRVVACRPPRDRGVIARAHSLWGAWWLVLSVERRGKGRARHCETKF